MQGDVGAGGAMGDLPQKLEAEWRERCAPRVDSNYSQGKTHLLCVLKSTTAVFPLDGAGSGQLNEGLPKADTGRAATN